MADQSLKILTLDALDALDAFDAAEGTLMLLVACCFVFHVAMRLFVGEGTGLLWYDVG